MKVKKRGIMGLLALAMAVSAAGCGKTENQQTTANINFSGYPIKSDQTLTYWCAMNSNLASIVQNFGDSPLGKALVEKTGVNVEFIHPPVGQETEQLSILLSTDDLPDIISNDWYRYSGGPQKALSEQILMPLNDVFDKYAPNMKQYLADNPEIAKMIVTDDNTYYVFPFIRGDEILCINQGIMIRQDWLDELNLPMPETIDEWHDTLTAFKEKKGAAAPLIYHNIYPNMTYYGAFIGAFGINGDFFVEDGKVVYGPGDERYKDFLSTFAQWYKEGLIEENLPNVDTKNINANMLNGKSGATFGYAGSVMGQINKNLKAKDPNARVAPAPYVAEAKGEKPKFGQLDCAYLGMGSAGITTSCKNVELAARFLDYGYSEEGDMLYNFGIEGESYNMVDGYPTYTDLLMKNPDGLTVSQAMSEYICASHSGPFVQRKEYIEQYYETDEQKDALKVWGDTEAEKYTLPPITFTVEESDETARIMTNIKTFVDEKTITIIMGKEDISTFDSYISTLKDYGLDKVLEIYNAAYQRYINR